MKIITWNVNGIRAALGRNALDWAFEQNPHALCLQEVKARPQQLNEDQVGMLKLPFVWNAAQRPGYSGVTTFYKDQPDEITMGMDAPLFDGEGRVIQTVWADLRLFNIYFPNGQRGQERVEYKLEFYAHLLDLCNALHRNGEGIIITGDFNTAHQPIDLKNPKENEKTSGFLPEERAKEVVAAEELRPHTPNTITKSEALLEHLSLIRSRGYALDEEEHEEGIRCIATPLLDRQSHVLGAVSITTLAFRVDKETMLSWWPQLRDCAQQIATILEHHSP